MLHSHLLYDNVQLSADSQVLILNSAADPFVLMAAQRINGGAIILAEDNLAAQQSALKQLHSETGVHLRHVAFHEYTLHEPPATIDIAVMNMLYQPSNAWMVYGLEVAAYALKPGGYLYILGAKDRGVLSMAKRMQEYFGNVETLAISKGHRVLRSYKADEGTWHPQGVPLHFLSRVHVVAPLVGARLADPLSSLIPTVFAKGNLDEGTRLLLEALEVRVTDEALDIGCGAGFVGLHIARLAHKGSVTMVDVSLAAVAVAQRMVEQSGLSNLRVLPSDGAQAVLSQRFSLVVTNPPFHMGGIQTTSVAERFIREAAQVLRPRGRFYLVANRFLKYEPTLRASFNTVEEVAGNTRYKVLRASKIPARE